MTLQQLNDTKATATGLERWPFQVSGWIDRLFSDSNLKYNFDMAKKIVTAICQDSITGKFIKYRKTTVTGFLWFASRRQHPFNHINFYDRESRQFIGQYRPDPGGRSYSLAGS